MILEVGNIYRLSHSKTKHIFFGEDENHLGCFFFGPVLVNGKVDFLNQYVINHRNIEELNRIEEWREQSNNDTVNNPAHYASSACEVIDIIDAFNLNFYTGNIIKYVLRHDKKGNPLEDLKKAKWYIGRYIELMEAKND